MPASPCNPLCSEGHQAGWHGRVCCADGDSQGPDNITEGEQMLWDGRETGTGDGDTKFGLESTIIMHKNNAQQLSG